MPSTVKVMCVSINPAVVTELSDKGTAHAVGIITDIENVLPLLVEELRNLEQADNPPRT